MIDETKGGSREPKHALIFYSLNRLKNAVGKMQDLVAKINGQPLEEEKLKKEMVVPSLHNLLVDLPTFLDEEEKTLSKLTEELNQILF